MSTHDVEALIVGCPDVAVALGDREVALADVADGAHEDGRVAQRRLHEGVGQRRDPPQPLALTVQVHEEDAALELGGGEGRNSIETSKVTLAVTRKNVFTFHT